MPQRDIASMKNIIIFGAGLSATSLIKYLLSHAEQYDWTVTVVDRDAQLLESKTKGYDKAMPLVLDITDQEQLDKVLTSQDIAISLLPPALHRLIAQSAIRSHTHLFTASYVDDEMQALEPLVQQAGLVFMCELGADPGIDHLSMVKMITEIKNKEAKILDVKSMTGALVDPEDLIDCPLKYKFTWNPDNVIRAGENGGAFVHDGYTITVPYESLYKDVFPVEVEGIPNLYSYYNRDAYPYLEKYSIQEVKNFMRGTLRYQEFLATWDVLVQTGITHSRELVDTDAHTVEQIYSSYFNTDLPVADYLRETYPLLVSDYVYDTLIWLKLSSSEKLNQGSILLYQVLKYHLIPILKLKSDDRDLLIMKHEISYKLEGQKYLEEATMKCYGQNAESTAIADTVGLPLAIFTKLFATGAIALKPGVHIPTDYNLCNPILDELELYDIKFRYKTSVMEQ